MPGGCSVGGSLEVLGVPQGCGCFGAVTASFIGGNIRGREGWPGGAAPEASQL